MAEENQPPESDRRAPDGRVHSLVRLRRRSLKSQVDYWRKQWLVAQAENARMKQGIEWALMHLETNIDIDGNKMADSDAARTLRECQPNDKDEGRRTLDLKNTNSNL